MSQLLALSISGIVSLFLSTSYVTPLLFTLLFVGTVMVADSVNVVRTALASSLFGAFAALLVVGYQISRARPLPR